MPMACLSYGSHDVDNNQAMTWLAKMKRQFIFKHAAPHSIYDHWRSSSRGEFKSNQPLRAFSCSEHCRRGISSCQSLVNPIAPRRKAVIQFSSSESDTAKPVTIQGIVLTEYRQNLAVIRGVTAPRQRQGPEPTWNSPLVHYQGYNFVLSMKNSSRRQVPIPVKHSAMATPIRRNRPDNVVLAR